MDYTSHVMHGSMLHIIFNIIGVSEVALYVLYTSVLLTAGAKIPHINDIVQRIKGGG